MDEHGVRRGARLSGIDAPTVLDGPIAGEIFLAYVERVLVPCLRPGDIVVMDTLGGHKGAAVRQTVEAAGAVFSFSPPYSPGLNPIEMAFSKLKALLREAAEQTRDALWDAVALAIEALRPVSAQPTSQQPAIEPERADPALKEGARPR